MLFDGGLQIFELDRNKGKAHAAVDVVADAAGTDDAGFDIHRGDAADGKSVAPVHVRHGDAVTDDAGKASDIADLF